MTTPDHLDEVPHLWNSASNNPAVQARQRLAAGRTAFLVTYDPNYAQELALLQSFISDYHIPLPENP